MAATRESLDKDVKQHEAEPSDWHPEDIQNFLGEMPPLAVEDSAASVTNGTLSVYPDSFFNNTLQEAATQSATSQFEPMRPEVEEGRQDGLLMPIIGEGEANTRQLIADLPLWRAFWTAKKMMAHYASFEVADDDDPYSCKLSSK